LDQNAALACEPERYAGELKKKPPGDLLKKEINGK
jgi:hypothetical protein